VKKILDPNDAKEQFPGVHTFLMSKWYFDELYSVVVVRPALVVSHWFKAFDLHFIDGILHGIAAFVIWLTRLGGRIDHGIVDGMVNLVGNVIFAVGAWLRGLQTGYLRSYILFLALAAIGIFVVLSYFVAVGAAAW
jgi:NADH-quinone oxidoreductase subunit L